MSHGGMDYIVETFLRQSHDAETNIANVWIEKEKNAKMLHAMNQKENLVRRPYQDAWQVLTSKPSHISRSKNMVR